MLRLCLGLVLLCVALLGVPAVASAACTDSWVGPAEGSWETAKDWSLGAVPSSSDVACVGAGKTVTISSGTDHAAVLLDEGSLSMTGGALELEGTTEASSVAALSVVGASVKVVKELVVSASFTGGGFGSLKGAGTAVIGSGAAGSIAAGSSSEFVLSEVTLKNAGMLTIGRGSGLSGEKKAHLVNSGTLIVNGETSSENHGLVAAGGEALLTNKGVLEKTEGTGTTTIEFEVANEGKVSVTTGHLEFSGGGSSGVGAVGSWSASGKETGIVFNASGLIFSLGAKVPMSGAVEVLDGTVTAGVIEGAEARVTVSSSTLFSSGLLEVIGESPSTLEGLTITHKETGTAGGVLATSGQIDVTHSFFAGGGGTLEGAGTVLIEAGATGSLAPFSTADITLVEATLKNAGTLTIGAENGIQGSKHAKLVNSGTLIVNGETSGENHGLIAPEGEAALVNTGAVEKTAGAGVTAMEFATNNEGKILVSSGKMEFSNGGTTGEHAGSWSTMGIGTEIVFGPGTLKLGSTVSLAGTFSDSEGTVAAGVVEGSEASLTVTKVVNGISKGVVEINGSTPSKLRNLTVSGVGGEYIGGGQLTGSGEVDVTGTFTGGRQGSLTGTGSTVIEAGATGSIETVEGLPFRIESHTLVNRGTLTSPRGTGILGSLHATILSTGTFILNGETGEENHGLIAGKEEAKLINTGTVKKTEGTGETPIQWEFENLGGIVEETGTYKITDEIAVPSEQDWGSNNPSAPTQEPPTCGDPVNCASGNYYETQTDFAIGGRGVGLDLTRTYNSQAGAASVTGPFGSGWSGPYSDHISVEKTTATLHQANGSTVPLTESKEGVFVAPAWSQDALLGSAKTGYSLVLANQVRYQFDGATGRLESITDRNGNQTKLAYAAKGLLEAVTDPAGRKITFAYNGEGLVESAKDPMGNTVKYTYESGNLATVTLPGETKPRWRYEYDGSHQMTSMTDGRGGKTTNEYDSSHRLISQTDPAEHKLKFEYSPFHTKITNNTTGAITDEHYTSDDELSSTTRGSGTASAATESFTYDGANDLTSVTDGNGHVTRYTYDGAANRLTALDPDEHQTKWTYDGTHDVLSVTTPAGEKTTITRDSHGNAETVSRPAPGGTTQTTAYHYNSAGEVTSVMDPLERTWSYEYNSNGDRTSETDPEGDRRTYGYDEDSHETSMVSPNGNAKGAEASQYTTKTERDAQSRPTVVTDPLGHTIKYEYDANGNLEKVTDRNGRTTTYTYNALDQPTKVTAANGDSSETEYDGEGRVISQTDGNKHTGYRRNVLGEIVEIKDPLGRVTKKEYDAAGNLTSVTDAAGRTTKYAYDPANRLKEITYSDGKTPTVKYEYDADGNRTKMADGTGKSTYTFDILDRLTKSTNGHGESTGYEYDLAGQQTKLTYPNGNLITRAYDNAGRLQSVTDWLGGRTEFAYDPDSNLTNTIFPASTNNQDKYAYDRADRLSEARMTKGTETLASLAYTRDNDGQIKTLASKGLPGEEKAGYGYDSNNRLIKAGTSVYGYDAADNPTKLGTSMYTYDEADQLKPSATTKYAYNEMGQRTQTTPSGAATTYGYDQAENLTTVERPAEGKNPQIKDLYAYDGNGLRTYQTAAGATTHLTWDTSAGPPLVLSYGTNNYLYGPEGQPIEQIIQSKALYLHHDQQGSTRLLTSEKGEIAGTYTFSPYGETTGHTGTVTTLLYDGQFTNADTGLIYLRTRVYDPSTAQFLSRDPLTAVSGEPYAYANDNPTSLSDPSGLIFGIPGTPSWEEVGEGIAGWGDTITLGATNWIREELGINNINSCSGAYQTGGYAGLVTGVLIPGEGEAEIGAEGLDETLAGLRQSKASIYEVDNEEELQALYNELSRSGKPATPAGYDGEMVKLPDETRVGLRNTSKSGGPALDIHQPGQPRITVHLPEP